jgi:site-specific recombinase XerD
VGLPTHQLQRLPRYLTQVEVRVFFASITDLRDLALFTLIYHYGLRVSEVALLTRGDVDLARSRIVVKRVKNGVWSERPLFGSTAMLLRQHLNGAADDSAAAPLFEGRAGPLQKRQIQSLFTRYRDAARLSAQYTCHGLRHSIATHLLDAGAPLEFVKDHLGHRSIQSTTIYAQITDRHRAAVYERLERSPWIVHPEGVSS